MLMPDGMWSDGRKLAGIPACANGDRSSIQTIVATWWMPEMLRKYLFDSVDNAVDHMPSCLLPVGTDSDRAR